MTGIVVPETSENRYGMNRLMRENGARALTANRRVDASCAPLVHSVFGKITALARAFQDKLQESIATETQTWLRNAYVVVPTK